MSSNAEPYDADPDDGAEYYFPQVCGLSPLVRMGQCPCMTDDEFGFGYPCVDCVESSLVCGHRATFSVSSDKPHVIECMITLYWVGDLGGQWGDGPQMSNPLDGTSMYRDGKVVKWSNLTDDGSGVASSSRFEFSETMDDSATAETFEPHAAILSHIFGIQGIAKQVLDAVGRAAIYQKTKKNSRVGQYKKPSGYDLDVFEKSLKKIESVYAAMIGKNFKDTYEKYKHFYNFDYCDAPFKEGLKHVEMIAGLIAHGLVECEARKESCPIAEARAMQMQKPCPHVAPKVKQTGAKVSGESASAR